MNDTGGFDADTFGEYLGVAALGEPRSFIDGEWVDASGDPFTDVAPAFGTDLATIRAATSADVDRAVDAAATAQPRWWALAPHDRAAILERAADALAADEERLAHLVVLDNGKTIAEARADVRASVGLVRSAAGWATRLKGTTLPGAHGLSQLTWREPLGVVGVIMPFNAPLMFCGMKIALALAVGNAVVAKAPEKSPLAAVAFCAALDKAGVPAGVVNLVHGAGASGQALAEHELVRMVSFTGSNAVGRRVGETAAAMSKRVVLELGGKSANIVFDDAPLDEAVAGSLRAIFANAGQRCFSGSRLLVHEPIADEFIERLVADARALRVGNPFDPATDVGALITDADVVRVDALVAGAEAAGATILCGGHRPDDVPPGGAFYRPTIVDASRNPTLPLLGEEVFGPVLTVQRFENFDAAIELANNSAFGLAGGCWTRDIDRALNTARAIDTGMFWINSYAMPAGPESSLEARRGSGFGSEKGYDGALQFTASKSVMIGIGAPR